MNQYEHILENTTCMNPTKLNLLARLLWPSLRIPNSFQAGFSPLIAIVRAKFLVFEEPIWFPPQTYHHLKRPVGQLNSGNKQQIVNQTNWGEVNLVLHLVFSLGPLDIWDNYNGKNYNGYLGNNDAFHWAPCFGVAIFGEGEVKCKKSQLGGLELTTWFSVFFFRWFVWNLVSKSRTTKVMKETCRKIIRMDTKRSIVPLSN